MGLFLQIKDQSPEECYRSPLFCYCAYVLRFSGWSKKLWFLKEGTNYYKDMFAQFMTMQKEQILARAVGIQKESYGGNWGIFQRELSLNLERKRYTF